MSIKWFERMKANKKVELGEATRLDLITTARSLFASGYDATSTPAIAAKAGVTRGALYHHFKNKRELFQAVVEQVAEDIVGQIDEAAIGSQAPIDGIIAGSQAFLLACDNSEIRQIFFLDAPAVLGWKKWREIDTRYGLGSLKDGLAVCADEGLIDAGQIDAIAHLISGALNEAVFVIAEKSDQSDIRKQLDLSIQYMILGLLRVQ